MAEQFNSKFWFKSYCGWNFGILFHGQKLDPSHALNSFTNEPEERSSMSRRYDYSRLLPVIE